MIVGTSWEKFWFYCFVSTDLGTDSGWDWKRKDGSQTKTSILFWLCVYWSEIWLVLCIFPRFAVWKNHIKPLSSSFTFWIHCDCDVDHHCGPTSYNFFGFTPPRSLNSEIQRCARLLREPLGLRGKEMVFSDRAWFEPWTLSIRRKCSIHSANSTWTKITGNVRQNHANSTVNWPTLPFYILELLGRHL